MTHMFYLYALSWWWARAFKKIISDAGKHSVTEEGLFVPTTFLVINSNGSKLSL